MTSTEHEPETPNSQTGLNHPQTVRFLQFAVVAMGIILVVGLFIVAARITYLYLGAGNKSPITLQGSAGQANIPLALPQGANITTMSLSGNRLAIHFSAPSGNGIRILNTKTGAVENTITLTPDIPAN